MPSARLRLLVEKRVLRNAEIKLLHPVPDDVPRDSVMDRNAERNHDRNDDVFLFSDNSCFAEHNLETAGFYELEGLDRRQWIKPKAVCRCRFDPDVSITTPCLMIRADARKTEWGSYLIPSVEGRKIGLKPVPHYGTFFLLFG